MRRAVVLLALAAWGCGSGSPGAPEPRVDPDALASCMVKLSGSPLFDPLPGSSAFAPAAFVFAAAREHEGDAQERHGNLLIVYDGRPSTGETTLVSTCLHKAGG